MPERRILVDERAPGRRVSLIASAALFAALAVAPRAFAFRRVAWLVRQ
jgi:hypothetical protein